MPAAVAEEFQASKEDPLTRCYAPAIRPTLLNEKQIQAPQHVDHDILPLDDDTSLARKFPRMLWRKPSLLHQTLRLAPDESKCPLMAVYIYMCILPCRLCNAFPSILTRPSPYLKLLFQKSTPTSFILILCPSLTLSQRPQEENQSLIFPRLHAQPISGLFRRAASAGYQVMGIKINQTDPRCTILPMSLMDSVPCPSSTHCQGSCRVLLDSPGFETVCVERS